MVVEYLPDPVSHPLWPGIRALLEPAAEYGGVEVYDPSECLWIAHDNGTIYGAATTFLSVDGTAEIVCCGGGLFRSWVNEGEATVTAWARDCGAPKITMRGRKGWARVLRAAGWVALGQDDDGLTIYEKDLASG